MKETEAIVSDCVCNKEEREEDFACMIKAVLPSWKNNDERILLPTFGVLPKFPFYGYKTQYKVIFEFLFVSFLRDENWLNAWTMYSRASIIQTAWDRGGSEIRIFRIIE